MRANDGTYLTTNVYLATCANLRNKASYLATIVMPKAISDASKPGGHHHR